MPEKENKRSAGLWHYLITFFVCLLIAFVFSLINGIFVPWNELVETRHLNINNEFTKVLFILCGAFFSAGLIAFCFGLLVFVANEGTFDMLTYGVSRFFSIFKKDPSKVRFKTFFDYREYKERQANAPFVYLLLVGLFFIVLSIVCLLIYNGVYTPIE